MAEAFRLKTRKGRAFRLVQGAQLRVTNTFGSQVIDAWAFMADDIAEFISMEHTRVHSDRPTPVKGTTFRSNRRCPMLEFNEGTSPGVHDWFFAACDQARYEMLGFQRTHGNCRDNLMQAMAGLGYSIDHVPCPLNLFENAPLPDGDTAIHCRVLSN